MFQKHFSKDESHETAPSSRADRSERPSPRSGSTQGNVILSDVEIVGTVRFKNNVVIDGRIDGELFSDGSVTVGRGAVVNAEIRARNVFVEGTVNGNIVASERLELMEHAEVSGDIKAAILSMQAGAVLIGTSSVGSVPGVRDAVAQPPGDRVGSSPRERSYAREDLSLAHA